jgi:hypothetical protein
LKWLLLLLAAPAAWAETTAMAGQLGSRPALMILHASKVPEGGWQLAGEYIVLSTLQRRFLEGEASPEIGVTTLREGTTPILFGRTPTGELRGSLRGGTFKGTRYAPGGQERERFEFSEEFASMEGYSGALRCEAGDARYASSVNLPVQGGKVQSIDWRSKVAATGHSCQVANLQQEPWKGGLRLTSGRCTVSVRDLGEYLWLAAENCHEFCGSQAYLEPVLVDRRGSCRLLRGESR